MLGFCPIASVSISALCEVIDTPSVPVLMGRVCVVPAGDRAVSIDTDRRSVSTCEDVRESIVPRPVGVC